MANYLMKYKSIYRLLPELDLETHDFPRDEAGNIDDDAGIYIACQNGSKITYWGLNDSRRGVLVAYIPSLGRGRNVKKALKKQGTDIFEYSESDEEVMFKFLAADIEPVAELMKVRTSGANISPFSAKNLPKNKDVVIPDDEMSKYKAISGKVDKKDILMFKKWNSAFLEDILQRKIRKDTKDKKYNYKEDMKKMKLSRQTKEFIFAKNMWNDYCDYLAKEIESYYN